MKESIRALKFTIISASAGLIQAGSFVLFNLLFKGLDGPIFESEYGAQYLLSLLLSVIWNFTINRKYTFKSANNIKTAMLLVFAFYVVFTPLSTWLGILAKGSGVNEYIVVAITMLANFVLEYLYTRFVVYRNSCDTAEQKKKG